MKRIMTIPVVAVLMFFIVTLSACSSTEKKESHVVYNADGTVTVVSYVCDRDDIPTSEKTKLRHWAMAHHAEHPLDKIQTKLLPC